MVQLPEEVRIKLDSLNRWLAEVYGTTVRISTLLELNGFSPEQVEIIKETHLSEFIQAALSYICLYPATEGRLRAHDMMIRYYGLSDGQRSTLQEIGFEYGVSRERVRQLINKGMRFFKSAQRKQTVKLEIANIARGILGREPHRSEAGDKPLEIPAQSYDKWTSAEENRLLAMVQQDKSIEEMAAMLRRSTNDIRSRLKKLVADGLSEKTTAKINNLFERPVKTRIGKPLRHGKRWSQPELKTLMELYHSGLSINEIAQELERSSSAIRSQIRDIRNEMLGSARLLGLHPDTQQPIAIFPSPEDGPVVIWGSDVIPVPRHYDLRTFSLADALELLA